MKVEREQASLPDPELLQLELQSPAECPAILATLSVVSCHYSREAVLILGAGHE